MQNNDWKRQYEMNYFATNHFWKMGGYKLYIHESMHFKWQCAQMHNLDNWRTLVISEVQARAGL